ncbi:MAG: glycosyltransferase family 4 protein [Myxococcota bacterium]|nr:glycosyltransferase family 4 protein [Myxococcota bacterium]
MHVALFIERFEAAGGGLEHAAWQTAHTLAEAGDRVTVVCRSCDSSDAVETVRLRVPSFWQPLRIQRYATLASKWLAAHRSEHGEQGEQGERRVDVSHAWSRVPGADIFHTGEGCHADYMKRTYGERGARLRRASPRHIAQLRLERDVYTHAEPAVTAQCVSSSVAEQLLDRYGLGAERTPIIGYGVDTDRFAPVSEAAAERARRNLVGTAPAVGTPVFAFVGSGWRRKGLDTAIGALAGSRDERAELWVAGRDNPGSWRKLAAALGVEKRVRFLGARADIEAVYAACDAWLLPTRYDAFGLVGLEAAAAGLPGIVSSAAGVSEVVGPASIVVDSAEDTAGFSAAIDRLCDAGERKRLGERALGIAAEQTWRAKTEQLRTLYARVRPS